ncbi:MAG: hypothetical protein M1825_001817 [Sarcosagium campestre]|nr:MAG: hypothetical protein M1825_001817 [Sarcosagium campestre]
MATFLDPINQEFANILAKSTGPKLHQLSYKEARDVLEGLQRHEPADDVTSEDFDIPTGPLGSVHVLLYKPVKSEGKLRTFFYIHGGGWILGRQDGKRRIQRNSPNTHDRLIRDLVRETGLACVFVYYSPAPEQKYPVQIEESYAAVKYIAEHFHEKGLDVSKFAIAGDSVGGQLAVAVSALAAERSGPKIVYQVLFYPVTNIAEESETYEKFKDGPYLLRETMRWMITAFAPDSNDRLGHLASPLLSSKEQLARLPPTLIVVANEDPLRGEGEAFAHALQEAGVETAIFRAIGQVHDFVMLNNLAKSATARTTIELAGLKLKKALAE